MAMFKMPTKEELTQILTSQAAKTKKLMEANKSLAEQMERLTNDELMGIGYDLETEINYIRSFCVAMKNLELRYQMAEPTNTDSIVHFNEYMLSVRNF